jgi:hypothetical protein
MHSYGHYLSLLGSFIGFEIILWMHLDGMYLCWTDIGTDATTFAKRKIYSLYFSIMGNPAHIWAVKPTPMAMNAFL